MSKELDLSIDKYISDEFSICREERQYALYLSNVLRYYGKNPKNKTTNRIGDNEKVKSIFEACFVNIEDFNNFDYEEERKIMVEEELKKIVIEKVFYEATFMRDIFERNRRRYLPKKFRNKKREDFYLQKTFERTPNKICEKGKSFNRKLIEFCINKDKEIKNDEKEKLIKELANNENIEEIHYGMKDGNIKIPNDFKKYKKKIRAMMNSKPDLAVIYYNSDNIMKKYLLFFECKFESPEDNKDGDNGEKLPQTKIQGYIADFLCKYYFEETDNISISSVMKTNKNSNEYQSKKIQFSREQNENTDILISSLIDLEKEIFNK